MSFFSASSSSREHFYRLNQIEREGRGGGGEGNEVPHAGAPWRWWWRISSSMHVQHQVREPAAATKSRQYIYMFWAASVLGPQLKKKDRVLVVGAFLVQILFTLRVQGDVSKKTCRKLLSCPNLFSAKVHWKEFSSPLTSAVSLRVYRNRHPPPPPRNPHPVSPLHHSDSSSHTPPPSSSHTSPR